MNRLNHRSIQGWRHQVLIDVVAQVGETCNFTTLDGAEIIYLDRVESQWPLRLVLAVGSHVPLHCTASGKMMLSHLSPKECSSILPHLKLDDRTHSTVTRLIELEREIQETRERGYSNKCQAFNTS